MFAQRKYTRFWLRRWLSHKDNKWTLFVVFYVLAGTIFQLSRG